LAQARAVFLLVPLQRARSQAARPSTGAMNPLAAIAFWALCFVAADAQSPGAVSAISASMSPIRKVITLLQDMKAQVEKEAEQDLTAYDRYRCWCETNRKEKTAAVEVAEQRINELETFLQQAVGQEAELKTEIAGLEDDIAKDNDALATATGVRDKENAAFLTEEADMKESLSLLSQAVQVLAKVQLVQKQKGKTAGAQKEAAALVQVRALVQRLSPNFHSTLQRDLFDALGALQGVQQHFLDKSASFEQAGRGLPWIKSDEQQGMEANPNDLRGQAAGAKSYNSRSGSVIGILKEMGDEFARDLASAQKSEIEALKQFQHLRAAKLAEISAATGAKDSKEAALADLLYKAAKADEDLEVTKKAMGADQEFLVQMTKGCKVEDEEFAARSKVRSEEIRTLAETIAILNSDDSRDVFGKTIALVQVNAVKNVESAADSSALRDRAANKAMRRIVLVARRHKNWALASLAVRVRLDAFTEVREAMDKMLAELQRQQKEEYAKWEFCKKEIDQTEDNIKVGMNTEEDLKSKHTQLVNQLAVLNTVIADLRSDVANMEMSLKQVGEDRKAENTLYQTSVADQRVTISILKKALARLKAFYDTKGVSLASVHSHRQEPGARAPPPPPSPSDYSKAALGGGVMQLLTKIITDAEIGEQQLKMAEQKSQADYASVVQATTKSIEANREAIGEKMEQMASMEATKSHTEGAQVVNEETLAKLRDLLKATHLDCDYIVKYFDIRQTARSEEMDAITDAKSILSGANFS